MREDAEPAVAVMERVMVRLVARAESAIAVMVRVMVRVMARVMVRVMVRVRNPPLQVASVRSIKTLCTRTSDKMHA